MSLRERLATKSAQLRERGADPRRADPRFTQPISFSKRLAVAWAIALFFCGMVCAALCLTVAAVIWDLRPAHAADIRLATIVRSIVPHPESESDAELAVRLALPPELSRALAPLVTTDKDWTALDLHWLTPLLDDPPIVLAQDRIKALGELISALVTKPADRRVDTIRDLVDLYVATLDPDCRTLIQRIASLSPSVRHRLVNNLFFTPLLEGIASLSESQTKALADSHLQLMPDEPERQQLIVNIPNLDLAQIRLVNELGSLDPGRRNLLLYVVNEIRSGSPRFTFLLTLYQRNDPQLAALIAQVGFNPAAQGPVSTLTSAPAPRRRRPPDGHFRPGWPY